MHIYRYMNDAIVVVFGKASSSDVERELSGLPEQEKQRETELTLLSELLTSHSQIQSEQQELQESLVNKDKELSDLRSKLNRTESSLSSGVHLCFVGFLAPIILPVSPTSIHAYIFSSQGLLNS